MANKSVGLLNFVFGANLDGFERAMKKANKRLDKFSKNMQKTGKALSKNLTLPIAALGAASVKSFNDQAQAEQKLLVSLNQQVDVQQKLIAQAKDLQTQTLFGDEATIEAQSMLAMMGLQEDAILKLTPLIQDMAAAKGMDLVTASDLVAKSLGSSTNALSRYGITIEGAVGSSERLDTAVSELTTKFGGQASAMAQVGVGPLLQLKNAWGDLGEDLGRIIAPAVNSIANSLRGWVQALANLNPVTQQWIVGIGAAAAALGPLIFLIGKTTVVLKFLMNTLVMLAKNPIVLVITAIGALAISMIDFTKTVSENWTDFVNFLIRALNGIIRALNVAVDKINEASEAVGGGKLLRNIKELEEKQYKLAKSAYEVADATKIMNKEISLSQSIRDAESKAVEDNIGAVYQLRDALKDATGDLSRQREILAKLKKISPEYFGSLKTGKNLMNNLETATKKYTNALKDQAKTEALVAKLKPLYGEFAERELLFKKVRANWQATGKEIQEMQKNYSNLSNKDKLRLKGLKLENSIRKANLDMQFGKLKDLKKEINEIAALAPKGMGLEDLITTDDPGSTTTEEPKESLFEKQLKIYKDNYEDKIRFTKEKAVQEKTDKKLLDQELFDMELEHLEGLAHIQDIFGENSTQTYQKIADMKLSAMDTDPVNKFAGALGSLGEKISELTGTEITQLEAGLQSIVESLGDELAQGAESFEEFGKVVANVLKDVIGGIISQGIAAAVANALTSTSFLPPFLIPVVAGLAAGLARTAFNSLIPAFAQGGLVTGPTQAIVGEGSGTSMSNPEVIAPLDKLKSYMGGNQVQVEGVIKGNDIFISNARTKLNRQRTT